MELVKHTVEHSWHKVHGSKREDEGQGRDHVAKNSEEEGEGLQNKCWEETSVLPQYLEDPHMCVRTPTKAGENHLEGWENTLHTWRARDNALSNHELDWKLCNSVDAQ